MPNQGFLYILQSFKNNRYYIGSTKKLSKRLQEHFEGKSKYTKGILPLILVFSQEYKTYKEAFHAESWLKQMKNKLLIEKIIKDKHINRSF